MNKTAIKNFAVWARNKLIADISYRAGLMGITERGIASALPQSTGTTEFYDIGTAEPYVISEEEVKQRERLVELIKQKERETDYKTAYKYVVEEVAYTWFNRLIAIRFMEVNDYLPSHIRVLSSESGKVEPDLVSNPFESNLDFTSEEEQRVISMKQNNELDSLFRMLFIKQCNSLNLVLPELFEKTKDYTELLLNISFVDPDGVVYHLVHDIEEKYFKILTEEDLERYKNEEIAQEDLPVGQVEIIGWLYQYYNIEPKDEAFALLKKNIKISKERIPAATQLFTPDWIVCYLVENSLGRLWLDGHQNEELKAKWKYYLDDAVQTEAVEHKLNLINADARQLRPEDIRLVDPCMGSGHILVYAFDILMQIYESAGYSKRDAVSSILKHNIYGMDIDKRAFQLTYFAVVMKARQYDRRLLTRDEGVSLNLYRIESSQIIDDSVVDYLAANNSQVKADLIKIKKEFANADEVGSIVRLNNVDFDKIIERIDKIANEENLFAYNIKNNVYPFIKMAKAVSDKYHVVVTNPPYMGSSGMDKELTKYVKKHYSDTKSDLFAVFIEKCASMLKANGYQAMITQHAWMFLVSYEKLRINMLDKFLVNMAHLGAHAFDEIGGEVVQTTAFVYRNSNVQQAKSRFARLLDYQGEAAKEKQFLNEENYFVKKVSDFGVIPGAPFAYWLSQNELNTFKNNRIGDKHRARQGMSTTDNERFVRKWYEINFDKISFDGNTRNNEWFLYNKSGEYRRWFGNLYHVVHYENDGEVLLDLVRNKYPNISDPEFIIKNRKYYFKEAITWSMVSTNNFAARYVPSGAIFDISSPCIFDAEKVYYLLGLMNSKVNNTFLNVINPTMNYNVGDVENLPYLVATKDVEDRVVNLVKQNIQISREDWDAYEVSWNFGKNPLVGRAKTIENAYAIWKQECESRYKRMKANEEELNSIFNSMFELEDDVDCTVDDKNITLNKPDLRTDIHNLLSYAVGCILGRYSLDVLGLACTKNEINEEIYFSFKPDKDNIIPITDEEYLEDDIMTKLCEWLKIAYSEESLEENLEFIANVLACKGKTSREIIRNYFMKDFFVEHCKNYQKRPIYWLYDSGKQNGFKALIYAHRYDVNTIGNLRVDYLHRIQRIYESEINRMQDMIDHSTNTREVAAATKRKEKLQKQLKECREYDEKIGHLALSRINIDLDDGVKANYEKVQTASDGKKYQVLAKI